MTEPNHRNEPPRPHLHALRNLVTAQASLDRAALRLAGIRRGALEVVLAAADGGSEAPRK